MGKNGGEPTDTILTLEEALRRFKRKRSEAGAAARDEAVWDSNVYRTDSSPRGGREDEGNPVGDLKSADESARASAQRDESKAGIPAGEIVALIDGIPRSLEELERIAAAEKAYDEDFPEPTLEPAEIEDDAELGAIEFVEPVNRSALIRDYAFTAMGTALMALVAVLVMRVPIVKNRPNLMAEALATSTLKAVVPMSTEDRIATWVIIPDADVQLASAEPRVKSDQLEARIKDTLKSRAFTDIGVSVSEKGDAYLAGEVYSLKEARRISQIVHRVNGVSRVHFLHPDVLEAEGPAFFGATTAWAPDVWGAKVRAVFIGSPADKAGLQKGDVISEFDGKTVPDAKTLHDLVEQDSPGQRVQLRVWHNGKPEYLLVRLGEVTTVASR